MDKLSLEDMEEDMKRINEVHNLVKELASDTSGLALHKADHYLTVLANPPPSKTFDRTLINKSKAPTPNSTKSSSPPEAMEVSSFMSEIEKDATERAARRKKNAALSDKKKERGNFYFKAGDFPQAIRLYSKAIDLAKDNMILYINRAIAYYRNHEYELALKDCDFVIYVNEKNTKAHFHRGKALLALGRPEESLKAFSQAVSLDAKVSLEAKEFVDLANMLIKNRKEPTPDPRAADKEEDKEQQHPQATDAEPGLWCPDNSLKLLIQLSSYQGLKVSSQQLALDDGNVMYFAIGVRLLTELMERGTPVDVAAQQTLFKDKGGFSLLKAEKHIIISHVMVEDISHLSPVYMETLNALWCLAYSATQANEFNAYFVAKETHLVNLAMKHLPQALAKCMSATTPEISMETVMHAANLMLACTRFLHCILDHSTALLAWLDSDPLPGQPQAQDFLVTLLNLLRLVSRSATHCNTLQAAFSKDKKRSMVDTLFPYVESLLCALVDNARFKTALCRHKPTPSWLSKWEILFKCSSGTNLLPPSTMTVVLRSYGKLLQFSIPLTASASSNGAVANRPPADKVPLFIMKPSNDVMKNLASLWSDRYIALHKNKLYLPLLQALALVLMNAWKRTSNGTGLPDKSVIAKKMVQSTTGALSQVSSNQVRLRPSFLALLDLFLPALTESDITEWCLVSDSTADSPFALTSNLDDAFQTQHFHQQLSAPLHIVLGIVRDLKPNQPSQNNHQGDHASLSSGPPGGNNNIAAHWASIDVTSLFSCAVKILALCCQHQPVVQYRVGDDELLVHKLAHFIDPQSGASGPLIANAALCLRFCLNTSKVAQHLHSTDIMRHLLLRCDSTKFDNANDVKAQSTVRANCATLAGTLARCDAKHYERFTQLHGLEIVKPFHLWNEKATC